MADATPPTLNAFKFHIEWAGASLGFSEASGLGEQQVLTLSRGLFISTVGFKAWLDIVSTGAHDLTINLQDNHYQIVATWLAKEATLINRIAAFDSDEHAVAIELLHVQHTGFMPMKR